MLKKIIIGLVVAGGMGVALYSLSPATRSVVQSESRNLFGWTETARQADPVGFTRHVEDRLRSDLNELQSSRRTLAMEVAELARKHREQTALLVEARRLAGEFQAAWRTGMFPVSIRNAAYTADDVQSQTSSLLAEIDGFTQTVARLEKVRKEAEAKLEEMTVRLNRTESELATIGAQRELLRSRVLSESGERLLTQVEQLLHGNEQIISDNPVRSVRELLAAAVAPRSEASVTSDRVMSFLTADEEKPEPQQEAVQATPVAAAETTAVSVSQTSLDSIEVVTKKPAAPGQIQESAPGSPLSTAQQSTPRM